MARKPASPDDKKISKAAAYRDAEKSLGKEASLDSVQKFIVQKHGIAINNNQISAYRSIERKRKGPPRKRGRKPKVAGAAQVAGNMNRDDLLDFVREVRGWENKLGANKLCEVIAVLYQNN